MTVPAPSGPARLLRWVWIPITFAALAALATLVDWSTVGRELAEASLPELGLMVAIWGLWLVVRPMRMRMFVRATGQGERLSVNDAFGAHAVGNTVNSLLPMRAGEVAMIWLLRSRAGVPAGSGTSAIVLDRLCDLFGALGLLLIAMTRMPQIPDTIARGVPIFGAALLAALAVLAAVLALRKRVVAIGARLLPAKFVAPLDHLLDGLSVLARPRVALGAVAWTAAIWSLIALSFYFGIHAIWPDTRPVMAIFTVAVVSLAFLVPAAPGGIGVFHAAAVFALSVFGVPAEPALAFAILAHALTFLFGLAVALVWVLANGINPRILTHRVAESADSKGE
jgi:glycosyltransferase 2 family protein